MATTLTLLGLPRELRDEIYWHYVYEPNGYHYDFDSGKLRTSTTAPINLSLMYTCKSIAAEMEGIALETNVVNFSTILSESTRLKAGNYGRQVMYEDEWVKSMLFELSPDRHSMELCVPITPKIYAEVAKRFPALEGLLQSWRRWGEAENEDLFCSLWGVAPSYLHKFFIQILKLIQDEPGYHGLVRIGTMDGLDIKDMDDPTCRCTHMNFWRIPSDKLVARMLKFAPDPEQKAKIDNSCLYQVNWRYSAVGAAFRFLESLKLESRRRLRNILIYEDQPSVAYPEQHSRCLVPFCKENKKLRITRRVNIWRTAIPLVDSNFDSAHPEANRGYSMDRERHPQTGTFDRALAVWITEALVLPEYDMPAGAFTLEFEAKPYGLGANLFFEGMKRHAAWQAAQDKWFTLNPVDWSADPLMWNHWVGRRKTKSYIFENALDVLNDIIEGRGNIRCMFEVGEPVTCDWLSSEIETFTSVESWNEAYLKQRHDYLFLPPSPSKRWHNLLHERLRSAEYAQGTPDLRDVNDN